MWTLEVDAMNWVVLIVWLLTAVGGFTLIGIWLRHGGMDSAVMRRFPPRPTSGTYNMSYVKRQAETPRYMNYASPSRSIAVL